MNLDLAPKAYDQEDEQRNRGLLEKADARNLKRGKDITLEQDERFVLKSPNGTLYYLAVADDGTLSTAAYS